MPGWALVQASATVARPRRSPPRPRRARRAPWAPCLRDIRRCAARAGFCRGRPSTILAAQKAIGETVVAEHGQPLVERRPCAARPRTVSRSTRLYQGWQRDRRGEPVLGAHGKRFLDPRGREVAQPRGADLAAPAPARRTRRGCRPAARPRRPCAGNKGRSARSRAAPARRRRPARSSSGLSPAMNPTLVAITTLSRLAGSRLSQRPIRPSLSPPLWPGTHAE